MLLVGQPLRLTREVDPFGFDPRAAPARRAQADVVLQDARLLVRDGGGECRATFEDAAGVLRTEGRVPVVPLILAPEDGGESDGVRPRAGDDVRRVGTVSDAELCAEELVQLRIFDHDRLAADGVDIFVFESNEGSGTCGSGWRVNLA